MRKLYWGNHRDCPTQQAELKRCLLEQAEQEGVEAMTGVSELGQFSYSTLESIQGLGVGACSREKAGQTDRQKNRMREKTVG